MKTKPNTIFRQLILTILLPVILLIGTISVYNFNQKKSEIITERKAAIEMVQNEIVDFLDFFDATVFQLEQQMSEEARVFSSKLVDEVFLDSRTIETANLDSVMAIVGMSPDQDIYIINRAGTIVNTTYESDLGMNFLSLGESFMNHFNNVWNSQKFIEDRASIEVSTGWPRKYTYQSTRDTNYVIELGFYNEASKIILNHFIQTLNEMPVKYEGIDTVSLYLGTNQLMSYQKHEVPLHERETALETMTDRKEREVVYQQNNLRYTAEYRFIEMKSSYLNDGYILRVVHNNEKEISLIQAELKSFFINLLIFVLPIFFLILWRARVLSRPISELLAKIVRIQESGDLTARVTLKGNNEVTELSSHFNEMVDLLENSYATLEQKVADRTSEVVRQKEIIENVFHEIKDSILYAKRLQDAILPNEESIKKYLPESFIFFQPKDVVSGDFYWMEEENGVVYFATADCTGHGVPGALVSVVCANALQRSTQEFGIKAPAEILNKSREIVVETFSKSQQNVKDGMDVVLCAFDLKNRQVTYAGAYNPLWLVRRKDQLIDAEFVQEDRFETETHVLIEFKATKQPIGWDETQASFDQITIPIRSGDQFYSFSDGYADQFGGPRGKKLKTAPFKKLILSSVHLPMDEQHDLLAKFIADWKGNLDQIDDICVVGICPIR